MSYLVLARKYRPAGFASVSGQDHVTRTLSNAILRDKVVHAFLFTGPRGVGKTSVSRILSKALNCQNPSGAEPCQQCGPCNEISSGNSLAVREIDGASHNSVDNVRELMDSFKTLPPPGYKNKVYIIDEVHMLSISAFNALLKSLEEPPPNTVFILATTEVHKIPDTVLSRCQRHDFRALGIASIESRLREICDLEGLKAEQEAITLIARLADGSMRDAQTLLDRVQTFCDGAISVNEASHALGTVSRASLIGVASRIVARDIPALLESVGELFSTGVDPATVLREFTNLWRELFIAKFAGEKKLRSLGVSADGIIETVRLVSSLDPLDVQDLWDLAREGSDRCLRSSNPRYGFEALVVRMAVREPMQSIGQLVGGLLNRGIDTTADTVTAGASSYSRDRSAALVEKTAITRPLRTTARIEDSTPSVESSRKTSGEASLGDWKSFLAFARERGGRILFENLKRLGIKRFSNGLLEATGPQFSITSLERESAKLQELLQVFSGSDASAPHWKLLLTVGEERKGQDPTHAPLAQKKVEVEAIEDHPALKSLQKVFPGSKVEKVKVKNV